MFGRGVAVTKLSLAVRKDAPSLFSYKKNRKARGEKRALTLWLLILIEYHAINHHVVAA
jgi:hypothetical protein